MRRRILTVCCWALVLMLVAGPVATAKDLGTAVLGNVSPDSPLAHGALIDRYPLSAYSLDYHGHRPVHVGVLA
jgi:hypothetical protein